MSLSEYTRKRDFAKTKEPAASLTRAAATPAVQARYVIQKHGARRLHYDLRLEHDGALLSWAVPKGPSLNPADKRLAVRVEDHPLDYATFEGAIPKGEYGAGAVMVWDTGTWTPKSDVNKALKKGRLSFTIHGEKLKGDWHLARMGGSDDDKENWLLIKSDDEFAVSSDGEALLREEDQSVLSGRNLDAIESGKKTLEKIEVTSLPRARKRSRMPTSVKPQLATLAASAPEGEEWIHEIKYDGYRLLAFCKDESVILKTRNDLDWTNKFPGIKKAFEALGLNDCIVDGELVATDSNGVSDFQALQNAVKRNDRKFTLRFMAFDLPYAAGHDLQQTALIDRKRMLASLLPRGGGQDIVLYSDHIVGNGNDVFNNACKLGLEGVLCKKADSPYLNRRSRYWLKVKCERRQEFVICGFTEPGGSRRGFGALHLAYYDDSKLRYAGKVGTGFNDKLLQQLRKDLEKLAIEKCPVEGVPADAGRSTWIKPERVAEVKYAERTSEGLLRQAAFVGLRDDKDAAQVRWETSRPLSEIVKDEPPESGTRSKAKGNGKARKKASAGNNPPSPQLTNPDRVLYPKIGATKEKVAAYYGSVADWMLPHVSRRPLSLVRHPRGWNEKGFFQKHIDDSFPDAVKRVDLPEGGASSIYGYVDDSDGLVALLQMGTLEIHAWGSHVDDVEKPDVIVMDLDPDEGLATEAVVGAALLLRDLLEEKAGLTSFLKATGGKGLHVVIPIRRGPSWSEVKAFSKAVAESLRDKNPKAFTTTSSKRKRTGKIYVDYLRNGRGATSIVPFSTRAREGAPVAIPLAWNEASPSLKSNYFTIENVQRRLSQLKHDPWEDYAKTRQSLSKSVRKAFGIE